MSITKSIGKNTLGGGKKMNVHMHGYSRSTHDLSKIWRNTQSVGTLVPFYCNIALPADTWDISLQADVKTHPTVGPLFGSFKLQLDMFECPFRLYQAQLHNNALKIGLDMSKVKLPKMKVNINTVVDAPSKTNEYSQINPSCLLAYLGVRGWNGGQGSREYNTKDKLAIPLISYFDIFKNYYANKQEDNFYIIGYYNNISKIVRQGDTNQTPFNIRVIDGKNAAFLTNVLQGPNQSLTITYSGNEYNIEEIQNEVYVRINNKWATVQNWIDLGYLNQLYKEQSSTEQVLRFVLTKNYQLSAVGIKEGPKLTKHVLAEIDRTRELIYQQQKETPWDINDGPAYLREFIERINNNNGNAYKTTIKQFGLALKTYQSDIFNNWVNTDWIDGENGINEITAVDVSDGKLNLDTLNLAQKVYNMLNRIAVSDGTYRSWLETVYDNRYIENCETPVYLGGLSQEIVFQEVISNSAAEDEPLGTLAGRGVLHEGSRKGGHVIVKTSEPAVIMGICSITPRIDYSQGNKWFNDILTMNDLHKPQLDGIGYQDLLEKNMAWWACGQNGANETTLSPGKSVAWINYMTDVNEVYGEFAEKNSENFMILDRKYEMSTAINSNGQFYPIKDMTTYIDPAKYNYIFADASLSAMNFWVQIRIDVNNRRKMSAKQIPNL